MSMCYNDYIIASNNSINENKYNAEKLAKSPSYRIKKILKPILRILRQKNYQCQKITKTIHQQIERWLLIGQQPVLLSRRVPASKRFLVIWNRWKLCQRRIGITYSQRNRRLSRWCSHLRVQRWRMWITSRSSRNHIHSSPFCTHRSRYILLDNHAKTNWRWRNNTLLVTLRRSMGPSLNKSHQATTLKKKTIQQVPTTINHWSLAKF